MKLGFADQEGFYDEAVKLAADTAKLGDDYDVFEIPKKRASIFDFGESDREDDINSVTEYADLLKAKPPLVLISSLR